MCSLLDPGAVAAAASSVAFLVVSLPAASRLGLGRDFVVVFLGRVRFFVVRIGPGVAFGSFFSGAQWFLVCLYPAAAVHLSSSSAMSMEWGRLFAFC